MFYLWVGEKGKSMSMTFTDIHDDPFDHTDIYDLTNNISDLTNPTSLISLT